MDFGNQGSYLNAERGRAKNNAIPQIVCISVTMKHFSKLFKYLFRLLIVNPKGSISNVNCTSDTMHASPMTQCLEFRILHVSCTLHSQGYIRRVPHIGVTIDLHNLPRHVVLESYMDASVFNKCSRLIRTIEQLLPYE